MIRYTPVPFRPVLSQAPAALPSLPPPPDTLFLGYSGLPGVLETIGVLAASGAATWIGIRTGLKETKNVYVKYAGWLGGVGAGLLGLLYLATKTGIHDSIGLPAVRVSPD